MFTRPLYSFCLCLFASRQITLSPSPFVRKLTPLSLLSLSALMSQSGVTPAIVESALISALAPEHLVVVDVSAGCGSKFELYVGCSKFDGVRLLERHRMVNNVLNDTGLMAKIHAVTIKVSARERHMGRGSAGRAVQRPVAPLGLELRHLR